MRNRDRLPFLLVPLAALIAVLPLILHGSSCGHDLSFHLLSWQEAATQFAHGNLRPRWAFTPAFGAGEPRFVFYPPLSWSVGALLTLLASAVSHLTALKPEQAFALTPILYIWIALTAAGLAMHRLARRFVSPAAATLAATLYLANPYTLFTAYERSAFAELLAAALLPLLLAALLPSPLDVSIAASVPAIAIPLALLWLTNAPAAVIGSYTVVLLLLLRLLFAVRSPAGRRTALQLVLRTTAASLLAFALAAFYLVPALLERPWVQISMAILPGLRPDDNTLFHHTADSFHDAVLHTASSLALILFAVVLLAAVIAIIRGSTPQRTSSFKNLLPLLVLTAFIAFLLTPASLPLWHHLPQLAFLQFPWRLLALLAPIATLTLALSICSLNLSRIPLALLSLALPFFLIQPSFRNFNQACDLEDTPQSRFALFHSNTGDDPTDEYTPAAADNDSLKDNNPPFRLLPADANDDTPPPTSAVPGRSPLSLHLNLVAPSRLVLNLRDYPTWRVTLNGRLDPERDHRADGLLTLLLPAGQQTVVVSQQTPAPEIAADYVSGLAVCVLAGLGLRRRKQITAA